jgi:hypothetical protein
MLGLKDQVGYDGLVLHMRGVLGGVPVDSFSFAHVVEIVGDAREPDVVGDDHGAWVEPALVQNALQIGQVLVLGVVEEDKIDTLWRVPDFIDTDLGCQFGEFSES